MSSKTFLYITIAYGIVLTIAFALLFWQGNRDVVINYPPIKVVDVEYRPIYYIFELPPHEIELVTVYFDDELKKHWQFKDAVLLERLDSFRVAFETIVDINLEDSTAIIEYDNIEMRGYEKIITKIVELPKEITKYKDVPFYKNNWFWIWLWEKLVILATVLGVVLL